ncbi:uncharacterized protein [Nicotiana sylvestris]|uniref:uncharacterized protein n=1 Tax=Nicotiana sylvestris TaxID=4096 RepID=UPI00388CD7F8
MTGNEVTQLEHNHPLFLQASDVPGLVLVPTKLTWPENYALWSKAMKLALRGKSKLGFVDKSCVKDMYRGELAEQWEKCNAMVLSWIGSTVASELISSIMFASSAKKVWSDFKEKFDRCSLTRIYHLWAEIASLRQAPKPDCDYEESRPSLEHILQQRLLRFLMGLNKSYSNVRSNVLMKRPVVSVNEVYAIVTQEKSQRALGVANVHLKENCCKIVGYPANFKSKKKTHVAGGSRTFANNASAEETSNSKGQPQGHYLTQKYYKQLVGLLNKPTGAKCFINMEGIVSLMSNVTEKDWIMDTRSTHHITCNKDLLDTLKIIDGYRSVQLSTGKTSNVKHTGNTQILGNQKVKDVLHGLYSGNVMGIGREPEGLYIIKQRDAENKALCDSLLASYGIIHQTSCPYTPRQNETVERKHRHILEVAKALNSKWSSYKFWGDCVKTEVYVINRLPTPVLKGRTPYELLYGKEPKVDYLRVFGYQCHATPFPRGDKFAPRVRKVVFIGDVVFQEGRFPFKDIGVEADDMFHQLPISPEECIPASTPIEVVTQEDTHSSKN